VQRLEADGYRNIIKRTRKELDLLDQRAVHAFFRDEKVEYAMIAAARVGGILANSTQPADFLYDNLVIATNTIHAAFEAGTEKLLFLGSSCIYPRAAQQPMREDAQMTGPLEPTNEAYALSKIAAMKLCEYYRVQHGRRFISATPTNIYGPGDNFDPQSSHAIPGLMRRFHEAKKRGDPDVSVWGSGTPRREFLHVDDLAEALLLLMMRYEEAGTINVGSGEEVTTRELAETMKTVVDFSGEIRFDASKPDGMPRKLLDSSRMFALGWKPKQSLRAGLADVYAWAQREGVLE
jgi:GDP-L-fucose synthase